MKTSAPAWSASTTWDEVAGLPQDGSVTLLDVRTPAEFQAQGPVRGDAVNIPLDDLRRDRLSELDPQKPVYVNCYSGLRSYLACRILAQHGFDCSNLSGGWRFWSYAATDRRHDAVPTHPLRRQTVKRRRFFHVVSVLIPVLDLPKGPKVAGCTSH